MKISIGIVGLPNVGKSTLFKLLTKQEVHIANYPFATIDQNVGVVPVSDERLDVLSTLSNSKKKIPTIVEFYDIAGLVKGANKGEGLGNQFLAHIRETDAIVIVLRVFKNDEIIHVEQSVDPLRDLEIIGTELALKDLEVVEKRLVKAEGEARTGDKKAIKNLEILNALKAKLTRGELVTEFHNEEIMHELQLLTAKKQLYLLNGAIEEVGEELLNAISSRGGEYVAVNLREATSMSELDQKAYAILNLISFFTTGEDESRAWTIVRGTKAPQAAGVIHTDFEKKFIRAEVINWERLVEAGGWNKAREKGWLRVEGKEYVVKDGDVLVIRHG